MSSSSTGKKRRWIHTWEDQWVLWWEHMKVSFLLFFCERGRIIIWEWKEGYWGLKIEENVWNSLMRQQDNTWQRKCRNVARHQWDLPRMLVMKSKRDHLHIPQIEKAEKQKRSILHLQAGHKILSSFLEGSSAPFWRLTTLRLSTACSFECHLPDHKFCDYCRFPVDFENWLTLNPISECWKVLIFLF